MGVIDEVDLPKIHDILADFAGKFLPMEMIMTPLVSKISSCQVGIQHTPELISFQKALGNAIAPFLRGNCSPEMFFEEPTERNIAWVDNYYSKNCVGDGFHAHITVGPVFDGEETADLQNFTASTLAVAHLGLHCTCRKVLESVTV